MQEGVIKMWKIQRKILKSGPQNKDTMENYLSSTEEDLHITKSCESTL